MQTARQTAFVILTRVQRDAAYSNLALNAALAQCPLPPREAALATALVYGVLERRLTLRYNLSLSLKQNINRVKPAVLTALEIGAFQLLFMDKIPAAAAVNESVFLVKNNGCAFAAGLVNALLRKVLSNGLRLPDKGKDLTLWLSVRYSCAPALAAKWLREYGLAVTEGVLKNALRPAPLTLRANTLRTSAKELLEKLKEEQFAAVPHPLLPEALTLPGGRVETTAAFKTGLFHVQDAASQLLCAALDPQPGARVLDLCAAPGGKSFTLAQRMEGRGRLLACDIYPQRVALLRAGAARLRLPNLQALVNDATHFNPDLGQFDCVLCDVPCSGLGVLRRKPEIRYKNLQDIDKLANLQYDILCVGARHLRPGGRLAYATCTLSRAENDDLCARFLAAHPAFSCLHPPETLLPQDINCDGFFFSIFTR